MMNEQNAEVMQVDSTGITPAEQAAINALSDRGYLVVIWTPEEVGNADLGMLNEAVTLCGNNYLDEVNNRHEEGEEEEE